MRNQRYEPERGGAIFVVHRFRSTNGSRALLLAGLAILVWLAIPSGFGATNARQRASRPNIIFILADDLGYMDIGANNRGTFYETPNLDRLASQGIRFTQAYAACPVCSPTRASILTGKYPARLQLTDFIGGRRAGKLLPAEYLHYLPLEEVTIAEALKEAGYATGLFGKWHLGGKPYLPEAQGFDVNIGGSEAGGLKGYFGPFGIPNLKDAPTQEYLTDRLTDEALKFIDTHASGPFLMYLAHFAVHIPLQAKQEYIAKYQAKASALPASTSSKFSSEHNNQVRIVQDQPVYAAMVQSLDESVGRIMGKLEALGIDERTVIIFFSDNGGLSTAEGHPTANVPLRAGKGWLYEGGIREPLLIKWPGVVKAGSVSKVPVISTDFYPTILEMAGLPLCPQQHRDGVSLVGLLKTGRAPERKALFWHYPHYGNQGGQPSCAVRAGDWKLIRFFENGALELYNLKKDLSEKHNLAKTEPNKVRQMKELLDGFLRETQAVLPTPNPDYESSHKGN